MIKRVLGFIAVVLLPATALPQSGEGCAAFVREGNEITLSADSPHPVLTIANTLAQQYGVRISAEEPVDLFAGDREDISISNPQWFTQHPGIHYSVSKKRQLEIHFAVKPDGSPTDVEALVSQLVRAANERFAFDYRIDANGEFFAVVPTRTRNEKGDFVPATSLLDGRITIPPGTRSIAETMNLMTKQLSAQTGREVSWDRGYGTGIPWGQSEIDFEAQNQPARTILEKLIELDEASGSSARHYWIASCDAKSCYIMFLNVRHLDCWRPNR